MYPVLVYDKNLRKLAEIDDYEYLFWRRRWRLPDVWQLQINRYKPNAELLTDDNLVIFQRDGKMRVGLIGYRQLELTSAGAGGENWQIGGYSFDGVFEQRLALHSVSHDTGYDTQYGPAETVMKHYVNVNCIETDDPDRVVPGLVLATNQQRGGNVAYRARFQTLAELLEDLSIYTGLGYDITVDIVNKQFVFEVREGANRTADQSEVPPVIFSPEFGNVRQLNYRHSKLDSKNVAIVAGQGEAANRVIVPVVGEGSTRLEYDAVKEWNSPANSDGLFQMTDDGLIIDPLNNPYAWPHETDFGQYWAGSLPTDWVRPWMTSAYSQWEVINRSGAIGGKVLSHTFEDGYVYNNPLVWDLPYDMDDVEVLAKVRASDPEYSSFPGGVLGSVVACVSKQYDPHWGEWVEVLLDVHHHLSTTSGRVSVDIRGTGSTRIGYFDYSAAVGSWHWVKLQVIGPIDDVAIRLKVWEDETAEPVDWAIDETVDITSYLPEQSKSGWAGFSSYRSYVESGKRYQDLYDYIRVQAILPRGYAYYEGQEIDLTPYGFARTNKITWDAVIPEQTEVKISVRIQTGGVWGEWQLAENGGGIPGINAGDNLAGKKLQARVYMAAWAIETTPILKRVNLVLNGRQTEVGYTGHDRREMFVDARDLDTSEQLAQRGGERLAGAGEEVVLEIENLPGKPVEYETFEIVEIEKEEEGQEVFLTGELVGVIAKPTGTLELDYE